MLEIPNDNLFTRDEHDPDAVSVRYLITSRLDPEQAALKLCREQSFGQKPVTDPEVFERFAARYIPDSIKRIRKNQFMVDIDFPIDLTGRRSLGRVLNVASSDTFTLKDLYPIRILGINLSPAFLSGYLSDGLSGPLYGIEGLREKLGVSQRPIIVAPVKPCMGLTSSQFANQALEAYRGGVDIVKDDELMADDVDDDSFKRRISIMCEIRQKVEQETGETKMYFAFIGSNHPSDISMLAKQAQDYGANGVMVTPAIDGWETIVELRNMIGLPIIAHNSSTYSTRDHGVAYSVFAYFQRVCGADIVITPGKYGTFNVMSKKDQLENIQALLKPLPGVGRAFPAFAGGQSPQTVPLLKRDVGNNDFIVVSGASVYDHQDGPRVGAKLLREAVEKLV